MTAGPGKMSIVKRIASKSKNLLEVLFCFFGKVLALPAAAHQEQQRR
jgi:hypothetical protein